MELDKNDAVRIIEYLEVIRTSLAKIGARYPDDPDELAKAICYFVLDFDVFKKISVSHRILVDAAENDEGSRVILNDVFENMSYWDVPQFISINDIGNKIKGRSNCLK